MLRGDARKVTTSATSSASMIRCIEFVAIPRSTSACERPDSSDSRAIRAVNLSVRVTPGWTTVTLIPLGPSSSARFLVSARSEEHTSELQSLMRISYAVFCLKKKKKYNEGQQYE